MLWSAVVRCRTLFEVQRSGDSGTVTVGEHELLNMAADIAVQSSKELTAEQRRELREIIGTLRRGRGKRA